MSVLLGFVGDVLVDRENPREIFNATREILAVPDILFANLESAYTDDPHPIPSAPFAVWAPARSLDAYAPAGFDVMSLANNHTVDVGYDAMLETRSRLRAAGVQTCGAGDSIADAREPAIVERDGMRIAFLAYTSVMPIGTEARKSTPGVAPMRARSVWKDPFPTILTPGMRPIVTTIPDEDDLAGLREDIRRTRDRADLVITSFHWGDHMSPFHLTDHEFRTAHFCIDNGADMVVGHHHHALRGMEWYRGKPIMYGLGHFVFDWRWPMNASFAETEIGRYYRRNDYIPDGPPAGWPLLPFPEDSRLTAMAWAIAERGGVREIGFLPCQLTNDGLVHPHGIETSKGREVVSYLEKCNVSQVLNGRLEAAPERSIAGHAVMRVLSQ